MTVSDLWVDGKEVSRQSELSPGERFVSNAMATAWRITDLPVPPDHLLQFAEAMTAATPGWTRYLRKPTPGQECGSMLFGALESPFGELISNSHCVVRSIQTGEFILAQLNVTALASHRQELDGVRLTAAAGLRDV
ncbi:hypothetical protein ACQ7HM_10270 [Williamsia sp. MIQD14]|uniref:hypothetical protein n=1 Tax=Williamsia sp. MIQD14 TaxID=3425703 RepID=UPI003DA1783A